MRQKVKRRWFACLWSVFLVFLCWWFISVARRNAQASYNNAQQNRGAGTVQLKVVVVEEHQEAFLVWADAVARGVMLPNSTLLYIDAHSSDHPPNLPPKSANFRLPKTEEEVDLFFQGNERFIAAAQVSQLLYRVVWVYPYWNTEEMLYRNSYLTLGRAMHNEARYVCECDKTFCKIEAEGREMTIPASLCAMHHSVQREAIRDVYARTRLPVEKNWLPGHNLVLSIDEDFFGVQPPAGRLEASGLSRSDVAAISEAIRRMLCPKLPAHEKMADRWFFGFVDAMRWHCQSGRNLKSWCSDGTIAATKFLHSFKADSGFSKMFCKSAAVASGQTATEAVAIDKPAFLQLWNVIRRLTTNQLAEVLRVGVCLEQSMRTAANPQFQLCVGRSNAPNNSAATLPLEHYPSPAELFQQFDRLRAILTALPTRPRLVTVARSSRDGYVPRELQAEIEQRVLQILRDVFKLKEADFIFDKFLLNGRQGDWYRRTYYGT